MKKCLSFILSVIMSISAVTQICNVSAISEDKNYTAENAVSDNATFKDSELNITGINSLGNLLANELESDTEEVTNVLENDTYGIFDLSMEGNTASVSYYAKGGATLLVGIYDETGSQLFASGTYEIVTEDDGVENLISEIEIQGEIPEYYLAKAFILGSNQEPLCNEYICELYTEDITKVRESVISDYDPDLVVNLDESEDTNFLVLSESTIQIEYNGETNILESADDENFVYIFSNADEQLLSLRKGDIFYYDYNNRENVIVVKISSIIVDGEKVTITGDDMELNDAFYAVKIEKTVDSSNNEFDSDYEPGTELGYGLTYEGSGEGIDTDSEEYENEVALNNLSLIMNPLKKSKDYNVEEKADGSGKFSWIFKWEIKDEKWIDVDNDVLKGSVSGSMKLKYEATCKIEAKVYGFKSSTFGSVAMDVGGKITGTAELKAEVIIKLKQFKTNFFGMIDFKAFLGVKLSGEVKGTIEGTIHTIGKFNIGSTSEPLFTYTNPTFDGDLKAEAEFFFGVVISEKGKLGSKESKGEIEAGVQLKINLLSPSDNDTDIKHDCNLCFEGELNAKFSYGFTLTVNEWGKIKEEMKVKDEFTLKLWDVYYSVTHDSAGVGTCPYKSYKVSFIANSGSGNPLESVNISLTNGGTMNGNLVTDSEGKASVYCPKGEYEFEARTVRFDQEIVRKKNINVSKPTSVTFIMSPDFLPVNIKVIDENGDLVEGAEVKTKTESFIAGETCVVYSESGVTDANGMVTLNVSTRLAYSTDVIVTTEEYGAQICRAVFSENNRDLTFRITPDGIGFVHYTLTITIIDENDNPISNVAAEIGFYGTALDSSGAPFVNIGNGVTDSNGKVKFWLYDSWYLNEPTLRITVNGNKNAECKIPLSTGETEFTFKITQDDRIDNSDDNNKENIIASGVGGAEGDNITWTLNDKGILNISGKGIIMYCQYGNYEDNINSIIVNEGITGIGDHAFYQFGNVKSITLPDTLTWIGSAAFQGCGIKSLIIPESVTDIGKEAFSFCFDLRAILLPKSVIEIRDGAFYQCGSLKDLYYTGSKEDSNSISIGNLNSALTSVKNIHYNSTFSERIVYAYGECGADGDNLTWELDNFGILTISGEGKMESCPWYKDNADILKIMISDGVTDISDNNFSSCTNLTAIEVSDGNKYYCSVDGALFNKSMTTLIKYPCGIENKDYIIPDEVKNIGDAAFSDCSNLASITLPEGIVSIRDNAFNGCSGLSSISIPNSVTNIGDYAFNGCSGLSSISIPNSVTNIGDRAFYTDGTYKLIFKDGVIELTEYFVNNFPCNSVSEIVIPDSVTSIGDSCFENFTQLTSVVIPDNVISIGNWAFSGCTKLKELTISDKTTDISNVAFGTSGGLIKTNYIDKLIIQNGSICLNLTLINCAANAKEIIIPDSVTSIIKDAFGHCSSLTDVYYAGTKEQWNLIAIDSNNDHLTNATIHYNSLGNVTNVTSTSTAISEITTTTVASTTINETTSEIILGDVNLDGIVTEEDVGLVLEYYVNISVGDPGNLSAAQLIAADVNGDGMITPADATLIREIISQNAETTTVLAAQTFNLSKNKNASALGNIRTYTYSEAVPDTSYLLLAVNDTEAEDILSADNLFYIDQQTADESGSVTFNYIASDDCTYIFIGDFGKGEYCRVVSNAISTNTEQCTICKSSSDDDFPDNGDVTTTTSSITTATTTTSSTTTTMTTTTTTTVSGICGDVNCDGKVNIADAVALEKYISGSSDNITEEGIKNADVNLDGVINDKDVHYLKLSIMNFIKLPYIVEDPDNGILYGDVTCDGIVNVCDVIILNKYLSNSDYYLSTQSLLNADVDCDGEVTREDSTYILKSIVHLVMIPINKSN